MSDSGSSWPLWSRLLSDFNADEETTNFGTRLAFEARGGEIYDVITWALFEPEVRAQASYGNVRGLKLVSAPAVKILHTCYVLRTTVQWDE